MKKDSSDADCLETTNIEVRNSQMFHQVSRNQTGSGQTVGPLSATNKRVQLSTDQSVEKEYFDEIYLIKQVAARRKLAYENN